MGIFSELFEESHGEISTGFGGERLYAVGQGTRPWTILSVKDVNDEYEECTYVVDEGGEHVVPLEHIQDMACALMAVYEDYKKK